MPGLTGKAPRKVLSAGWGPVEREQALHDALPEYYAQALTENDVDAIDAPGSTSPRGRRKGPSPSTRWSRCARWSRCPATAACGSRSPPPSPPTKRSTPRSTACARCSRPSPTSSVPREGDSVTIDITGTLEGETQDGLTADDYSYTVGSGVIPRGGRPPHRGQGRRHPRVRRHPPRPRRGSPAAVQAPGQERPERVLPEADDAWTSRNSGSTPSPMRDSPCERSALVRKAQAWRRCGGAHGQALAHLVEDEMPEALVNHEMNHLAQELSLGLQAQGLTASSGWPSPASRRSSSPPSCGSPPRPRPRSTWPAGGGRRRQLECTDETSTTSWARSPGGRHQR